MPRMSTWFACMAFALLAVGFGLPRLGNIPSPVISLGRAAYGLPNSLLCYGAAACFCFFAFLYGVYFLPWSERVQFWHFGLSFTLLSAFTLSAIAARSPATFAGVSRAEVLKMLVYVAAPWLFLLIQACFLADAVRRIVHGPIALGHR